MKNVRSSEPCISMNFSSKAQVPPCKYLNPILQTLQDFQRVFDHFVETRRQRVKINSFETAVRRCSSKLEFLNVLQETPVSQSLFNKI